jgi:hypothetical protein
MIFQVSFWGFFSQKEKKKNRKECQCWASKVIFSIFNYLFIIVLELVYILYRVIGLLNAWRVQDYLFGSVSI